MPKKNVLFVAYQFPPLAVGGSYRPYKFVKQLKENSQTIRPIVLTLDESSYSTIYENFNTDFNAYNEIKNLEIPLYSCPSKMIKSSSRISRFLSIYFNVFKGNEAGLWKHNFNQIFDEIIKKESIDLVYVTCPPFSIGNLVRKALRKYDIPYVADMRDNWTFWGSQPFGSWFHYYFSRLFEKKLYRDAKKVIGVTQYQLADLMRVYNKDAGKFNWIPNAFEYKDLKIHHYQKPAASLSIAYVGAFYYSPNAHNYQSLKWYQRKGHRLFYYWPRKEWWIYRSPFYFFELIRAFREKYPKIKLDIRFAGYNEPWLLEMIQHFGLEDVVHIEGYLKGKELENLYKNSDLLLTTSVKVEDGYDYCIASKSFDYIKSGKLVLGVVAKGAQREFLEKSKNAVIVDADHTEEGIEQLREIAEATELSVKYDEVYLNQFSIQETTRKLEDIFLKC